MPNLLFRGTFIRFIDVRYDEKSKTVYTKINLTADFSEPVREAMGWGMPAAGFASAKLDGEIAASKFILRPNSRQLKESELQLDAREAGGFHVVRIEDKDSSSTHNELRFQLTTVDPNAPALVAEYLRVIGKGEGQLKLTYQEQGEIEETEDAQGKLISEEQAADTAKADEDTAGAGTLASVTEMKRGRKGKDVQ